MSKLGSLSQANEAKHPQVFLVLLFSVWDPSQAQPFGVTASPICLRMFLVFLLLVLQGIYHYRTYVSRLFIFFQGTQAPMEASRRANFRGLDLGVCKASARSKSSSASTEYTSPEKSSEKSGKARAWASALFRVPKESGIACHARFSGGGHPLKWGEMGQCLCWEFQLI